MIGYSAAFGNVTLLSSPVILTNELNMSRSCCLRGRDTRAGRDRRCPPFLRLAQRPVGTRGNGREAVVERHAEERAKQFMLLTLTHCAWGCEPSWSWRPFRQTLRIEMARFEYK